MAKPSKLEFETKVDNVSTYTAAEANTVHTTIDEIIDDYASISEGVDADTLEGSTKAEVQTHAPASHGNEVHSSTFITSAALSGYEQQANKGEADGYAPLDEDAKVPNANLPFGYGETKLWNTAVNDVPAGWHVCDGTNGTPDFSLVEPQASTDTAYIMYIGGETVTSRTINITNNAAVKCSYTLMDFSWVNEITAVEDNTPFLLNITETAESTLDLILTCNRTSDDYTLFMITLKQLESTGNQDVILSQNVDCTWSITEV